MCPDVPWALFGIARAANAMPANKIKPMMTFVLIIRLIKDIPPGTFHGRGY